VSFARLGLRASVLVWLSLFAGACTQAALLRGRIAGTHQIAAEAERNGARSCAPRELAMAHAHLEFAEIELIQRAQRLLMPAQQCDDVVAISALRPHRSVEQKVRPSEEHRLSATAAHQFDVVTRIEQKTLPRPHLSKVRAKEIRHA
jgi:hypothetical protein